MLPDHYETVLLYIQSEPEGYVTIGMYDFIEMRWKDFCDINREVYQADIVTHWAHLPASPTCAGKDITMKNHPETGTEKGE